MFKHSVFASIFCAVRYPNIPRECKERQIFEAFTICTDDDDEEDNGDDGDDADWQILVGFGEDEWVRISSL